MAIHGIRRPLGRAGATVLAMGLCLFASLAGVWAVNAAGAGKKALVAFSVSPFPYRGDIPGQGKPFLDVDTNGRRGHTSPRGGVLWENETYSDKRVLLYIPPTFDSHKPAVLVLFFHGNQVLLERDVEKRQGVLRQLANSRLNAVFVAPQFAVNALDSSAGTFWQPGTVSQFLDEAASRLVGLDGGKTPKSVFASMPVVIVAYSGGYLPAAYSLSGGGLGQRLSGLVLMDAVYGEIDKFADWIAHKPAKSFVFSAFSESSREANGQLQSMLQQRGVGTQSGVLSKLAPGNIVFMSAGANLVHNDFLTKAWTSDPLRSVFARIASFNVVTGSGDAAPVATADNADAAPVDPPADAQAAAGATPLPPLRPDSAPKPDPATADDPAGDPAVGSLAPEPAAPAAPLPRNLGAIVPSASPPGFAAVPVAPMLGLASIELGNAANEQEALVKAAHLQAECANVLGNHKIKAVAKDGGKGFSIRIGPLTQMDYGFLCGRMTHGNCLCHPAGDLKPTL